MKKLFVIITLLFLYSCSDKDIQEVPDNSQNIEQSNNQENYYDNTNTGTVLMEEGKLLEAINFYENNENYSNSIDLAKSYLSYGNSFYKEDEYSKKALEILNNFKDNSFENIYYKGYSNEIIGNYEKAINFYEKSIELDKIIDEDKAIALNQIGHVYDLMGQTEKANQYYLESEEYGFDLIGNLLNRGRYEYRSGNLEKAEEYFQTILTKTQDSFLKSEIYFNLSSIYLTNQGEEEKAIEFAEKGIEENENYPYNYLNIGIANLYTGGENFEKAPTYFKKVLDIYPNSSSAYKYLGIYNYIKDDYIEAIENFKKQLETSKTDIVLMGDEKIRYYNDALYDLSLSYALNGEAKNSINNLEKLLIDNKNDSFYVQLISDIARKDSPFEKITEDEDFEKSIKAIIENYN